MQEFAPKCQHALTSYLESSRVYSSADLQLDRVATLPMERTDEDHASKMEAEYNLGAVEEVMLV
jgi:hypothetical protein